MFAGASPATGTAPVPVSGTVCGLPVALSATLTFALFAPVVVGANFTPTLQLALAAKLLAPKGQAAPLVGAPSVNCVGSVPVSVMLVMFSVAVPLLVIVTSVAAVLVAVRWLPNAMFVGASVMPGAVPVPVRGTVCGLPAASSTKLTFALFAPVVVGANI